MGSTRGSAVGECQSEATLCRAMSCSVEHDDVGAKDVRCHGVVCGARPRGGRETSGNDLSYRADLVDHVELQCGWHKSGPDALNFMGARFYGLPIPDGTEGIADRALVEGRAKPAVGGTSEASINVLTKG